MRPIRPGRLRAAALLAGLAAAPAAGWAGGLADRQASIDVNEQHQRYADFYGGADPGLRSCKGYPPVDCTPPVTAAFAHCCPAAPPRAPGK